MNNIQTQNIISIVIPTREGFSQHWLDNLLAIKGNVEFILVHPPEMSQLVIVDSRVKQINSPFRGELIQRMTGLLNVNSDYTLTINCDEYLIPEIVEIAQVYFQKFPDSWVLRLGRESYKYGEKEQLSKPWNFFASSISELEIYNNNMDEKSKQIYQQNKDNFLVEIPIAPLNKPFDLKVFWQGRKDHHGYHTENFDKKIWLTKLVKPTLLKLKDNMIILDIFKYFPFWCLDRVLGLAIQANFFTQNEEIIGHLLPQPAQIRIEDNPPEYSLRFRFYLFSELILLRTFPQYPYIWHLIIESTKDALITLKQNYQKIFNLSYSSQNKN